MGPAERQRHVSLTMPLDLFFKLQSCITNEKAMMENERQATNVKIETLRQISSIDDRLRDLQLSLTDLDKRMDSGDLEDPEAPHQASERHAAVTFLGRQLENLEKSRSELIHHVQSIDGDMNQLYGSLRLFQREANLALEQFLYGNVPHDGVDIQPHLDPEPSFADESEIQPREGEFQCSYESPQSSAIGETTGSIDTARRNALEKLKRAGSGLSKAKDKLYNREETCEYDLEDYEEAHGKFRSQEEVDKWLFQHTQELTRNVIDTEKAYEKAKKRARAAGALDSQTESDSAGYYLNDEGTSEVEALIV